LSESNAKIFPSGTLLIALYGATVGRVGLIGVPAATNQAVCAIFPDGKVADSNFLFFALMNLRPVLLRSRYGGAQPNISQTVIRNLQVPLPPLPEQKAIAHVLRTMQQAKEATEKVIAATRQLKQSLMKHLFTYGPVPFDQANNVELKETEIGPLPHDWEVVNLDSVSVLLQYGTSKRCGTEPSGMPVLRIPNVIRDSIDSDELKYIRLPEKEASKLTLQNGDLLFVRTNGRREYVGRCAVYNGHPRESLFASYLIRCRLDTRKILPEFFQMYSTTKNGQRYLSGHASNASDGKFNINTQILRKVMLPLPDIDKQRNIVGMIQAIQKSESSLLSRQSALHSLFGSLLHNLMSGKVRVPIDTDKSAAEVV
jgi:type I restriction enzyme S subunit